MPLWQQVVDRERNALLAGANSYDRALLEHGNTRERSAGRRRFVNEDAIVHEINDNVLRDPCRRIGLQLWTKVEGQRAIGDLDDR